MVWKQRISCAYKYPINPTIFITIFKIKSPKLKPIMTSLISLILFSLFILSWLGNAEGALSFNVIKFGAKPDGKSDATQPFLRAWASACAAVTSTSTIYVPKGRYLLRSAEFRGPCKSRIKVQIDGTLVAPMDHNALGNSDHWILFIQVNRITVVGGNLDAKGAGLWACKTSGQSCPTGARVNSSTQTILYVLF